MTWTAPATWTAAQVVGATDLNTQLRDNLIYLVGGGSPPAAIVREGVADYSTSSTSFVDVDVTNLIRTITPQGGKIWGWFACRLTADNTASSEAQVDVILDSTTRFGGTNGAAYQPQNSANWICFPFYFSTTAGVAHTIKPQYRNKVAATTTISNNAHPVVLVVMGA